MIYTLDSSVGFKWAVAEADTARARGLRQEYVNGNCDLIAPDIFSVEIGHALTRAERQQRISQSEAGRLWRDVMNTSPRLEPYIPLMARAIDLSSQFRIGVYDCLYVALAEREGCELVTADDRLVKLLQPSFPFVVALTAVP
jgi:predicted nucleic acid-binding protein